MAGLVPKEAQYGDQTALRRLGVKMSPDSSTPTFFNPQGGRPPGASGVPALGGEQAVATPPATEDPGLSAEHQSLYQRALDLAEASRAWQIAAQAPTATEQVKRTALAVKEAARIALLDARQGTPFVKGL